jgi:hypothetical protein
MAAASDYLEVAVLNASLRNIALQVAATWVGLNTADPTDAATANECTDSGYARKSATWAAPTSGAGTCATSADIDFNAIADAGPFVITHVSIWDAVSAGNLLYHAALSVSKSFSLADVPRFPAGSLVVSVA